jgi:hypothetical protein
MLTQKGFLLSLLLSILKTFSTTYVCVSSSVDNTMHCKQADVISILLFYFDGSNNNFPVVFRPSRS